MRIMLSCLDACNICIYVCVYVPVYVLHAYTLLYVWICRHIKANTSIFIYAYIQGYTNTFRYKYDIIVNIFSVDTSNLNMEPGQLWPTPFHFLLVRKNYPPWASEGLIHANNRTRTDLCNHSELSTYFQYPKPHVSKLGWQVQSMDHHISSNWRLGARRLPLSSACFSCSFPSSSSLTKVRWQTQSREQW